MLIIPKPGQGQRAKKEVLFDQVLVSLLMVWVSGQQHRGQSQCWHLTFPPVLANGTSNQHACFAEGPSIDKMQHHKG